MYKNFLDAKERALAKLENAVKDDLVDTGILNILNLINESENFYTSSSCAGRTVVLELPTIGDKKNAVFLGKWHRKVDVDEVKSAVLKSKKGLVWILAQSPIIHIGAITSESADKLLKIGIESGFKNSGLKSFGDKIIVEICSTERLDCPIGQDGMLFSDEEYLKLLVKIANEIFDRSQQKINRFEENLRKYLSTDKSTS